MPLDHTTFRLPVLVTTAAVSACASLGGGPPPALRGKVVDATSGEALPYVLVMFHRGPEVRADGRGDYAVRELPPGRHRVLVVAPGCRSAESEVRLPDAAPGPAGGVEASHEPVDIRVSIPAAPAVAGVVPPPDESRGRVVTDAEIVEMGVARLSEAVRRVAPEMVGAASGDPGRPAALRGRGSPSSSGPRVPVLVVDGIVVHAVDTSALDEIALADVAWVEILPGAVSGWEYGTDGAGGVIRVHTKRGYRPDRDLAPEHCPVPEDWQR